MQMHHGMQQLATIMALTTRSAAYDVPFSIDKWQEFLVIIFHINYFFVILSETPTRYESVGCDGNAV